MIYHESVPYKALEYEMPEGWFIDFDITHIPHKNLVGWYSAPLFQLITKDSYLTRSILAKTDKSILTEWIRRTYSTA